MRTVIRLCVLVFMAVHPASAFAADAKVAEPALSVVKADLSTLGADEARHVDAVRRGYLEYFDNNLNEFQGLLAEGASWWMMGPPSNEMFQEYDDSNVRDWFRLLNSNYRYESIHVTSFVAQGNTVVVFGSEHGWGRVSKREFYNNWVHVWTFSEDKVVSFRAYVDTNTLLLALQTP